MTQTVTDPAELTALREAVRGCAMGVGGVAAARRRLDAEPGGFDDRAWTLLGRDMGLAGLGVPENLGGAGGGLAELAVVGEELGRSLLPVPFLGSTVLAGQLLTRCDRTEGVLDRLGAGAVIAVAGLDADGRWTRSPLRVADGAVSGTVDVVVDGAAAELVVAVSDDGEVHLVDADRVRRIALETLDPSRGLARLVFNAAPAVRLTDGTGTAAMTAAVDTALVVLAAEQVGGAAAALDMAVEQAKTRHQFGRAIGSFQAIKHKLADLLLLVEMGRSAVDRALLADPADLGEAASLAKAWCSDAFTEVASENVHINGGTGFTWEHDAHLFFRRARADAALLGDATFHRERLAALLDW